MSKKEAAGVTVCVRIRPRNAAEVAADMAVVIKTVCNSSYIIKPLNILILWSLCYRMMVLLPKRWIPPENILLSFIHLIMSSVMVSRMK